MVETFGQFPTAHGSKYLQQLCKHFSHKIDVTFSETEGHCRFAFGSATLTANAKGLNVLFELEDDSYVQTAHEVIDKHLANFAFREGFTAMAWD